MTGVLLAGIMFGAAAIFAGAAALSVALRELEGSVDLGAASAFCLFCGLVAVLS